MLFMIYASSFSACANDEKINKGDNYNDEVIEKNINEDTRLNENIVEENEDIISIDEVISDIDENGEILEIMPAKYDYTHNIDLSVAIIDELSRENPNDNITFSETSLNVLLGMLYEGAYGETKEGIITIKCFGPISIKVKSIYQNIFTVINIIIINYTFYSIICFLATPVIYSINRFHLGHIKLFYTCIKVVF